jgi:hypothetical protein
LSFFSVYRWDLIITSEKEAEKEKSIKTWQSIWTQGDMNINAFAANVDFTFACYIKKKSYPQKKLKCTIFSLKKISIITTFLL